MSREGHVILHGPPAFLEGESMPDDKKHTCIDCEFVDTCPIGIVDDKNECSANTKLRELRNEKNNGEFIRNLILTDEDKKLLKEEYERSFPLKTCKINDPLKMQTKHAKDVCGRATTWVKDK